MENLLDVVLESWDRECAIVDALASTVQPEHLATSVSDDEWSVGYHLCHIHEVRYFWLSRVAPDQAERLGDLFPLVDGIPKASSDLDAIRQELKLSGRIVGETVRQLIEAGTGAIGGYDHPIFFLQHMLWHDGWHVGEILMTLRSAGQAPSEEWEMTHIWDRWRTE